MHKHTYLPPCTHGHMRIFIRTHMRLNQVQHQGCPVGRQWRRGRRQAPRAEDGPQERHLPARPTQVRGGRREERARRGKGGGVCVCVYICPSPRVRVSVYFILLDAVDFRWAWWVCFLVTGISSGNPALLSYIHTCIHTCIHTYTHSR